MTGRRLSLPVLLLAGVALVSAPAAREDSDAPAAPRGLRLEEIRGASILWGGEYSIFLRTVYFNRSIPVEGFPLSDSETSLKEEFFFSYGIPGGIADLSAAIDVYGLWYRPGEGSGRQSPPAASTGDIGDSRIYGRLALPSPAARLKAALELFVSLPTGNREKAFSSHTTEGGALIGLSWLEDRFRAHLQGGYRLNRNESDGVLLYPLFYPNVPAGEVDTRNDAYILRAGVEFTSPGVDLYLELFADRLFHMRDEIDWRENPLQITPGIRIHVSQGLSLSGSVGIGLSRSGEGGRVVYGTDQPAEILYPDWTASFGIHLSGTLGAEDGDGDGVDDPYDLCPGGMEDYDGYKDDDGCPDIDNDRDGILDDWDKAPNDPEDFDGFEDEDGAPEYDNDRDGIPDVEDRCPDVAEDMDGDRDDDGCPEEDRPAAEEKRPEKGETPGAGNTPESPGKP